MILTAAIILIAILIGFSIYQYNLRRDLQRSISVITKYITREQDDFKPLLYHTDNQELQRMITSLNTLLLQRYRLSRQYRDVQEQYRTNIADISHDLKTPITTLSGYIDLLVLKYREFGNNSPEVNLALQKTKQKAQMDAAYHTPTAGFCQNLFGGCGISIETHKPYRIVPGDRAFIL